MALTGKQGTRIAGASRLMNGVSVLEVALGNVRAIHLQAALVTNPNNYLWYRLEYATGAAATGLATADGFLTNGGSVDIESVDASKDSYLYLLLTDNAGTAANGGANDYILIARDL